MFKKIGQQSLLEKVGVSLSFVCAIHCIISPLFIAFLPVVSSSLFHNPALEIILLSSSFLIVGLTNLIGFIRHHRKYAPTAYMLLGFSLVISGHLTESYWFEVLGAFTGGLCIAYSIYSNTKAKKSKHCTVSHCTNH